jgi:hypothetical protein
LDWILYFRIYCNCIHEWSIYMVEYGHEYLKRINGKYYHETMQFSAQTWDFFLWPNEFTWNSLLDAKEAIVYSYNALNAFAAKLSKDEAQKLLSTWISYMYIFLIYMFLNYYFHWNIYGIYMNRVFVVNIQAWTMWCKWFRIGITRFILPSHGTSLGYL